MKPRPSPYTPEDTAQSPTLARWALLQRIAAANAGGGLSPEEQAAQEGGTFPATEPDPGFAPAIVPVAAPENRHGHIGAWTRDAQGRLVAPKISYD